MNEIQKKANKARLRKNDVFYTPPEVAKKMIEMCNISPEMKVLDPCYGGGVFYENLPECNKAWCEIEKGVDFFAETKRYDLIIGNPPFSKWSTWLKHTMALTDKFCYVMGVMNLRDSRIREIHSHGYGITHLHSVTVSWWFGTAWIVIFEKNKPSIISVHPHIVQCEICNTKCGRGEKGNSPNVCCYVEKPPKPVKEAKEKKPRKKSGPIVNAESEESSR